MNRPLLVSACLLGLPTRYDGGNCHHQVVLDYLQQQGWLPIPVCPEQLAGLPTPRPQCWFGHGGGQDILDGRGSLRAADGTPMHQVFLKGAMETLKVARLCGCTAALLKDGSPSCGVHRIRCNGHRTPGQGVTAALLSRHGLALLSEEDIEANMDAQPSSLSSSEGA